MTFSVQFKYLRVPSLPEVIARNFQEKFSYTKLYSLKIPQNNYFK